MAKFVNLTAGLGLAALLLTSACATSAPVSPEEAAANRARLAAIEALPTCADAEALTGQRTPQIPDCRLKAGASGPHLVITSDPIETEMLGPSGFISLSITSRQGRHIGDFSEITHGRYAYPTLRDANGDGRLDVVIPRANDAVNSVYSLWLQQENGDFAHAGEFNANQIDWSSAGLIAAAQRMGETAWNVSYLGLDAGKLKEVAVIKGAGAEPPERGGQCEIVRIAKGAEPGRFCSDR